MLSPLAANAMKYLQRRFPRATVTFSETKFTVETGGEPEVFRAWQMIAQDPEPGVKHRALVIPDLGETRTQLAALAQEAKRLLAEFDSRIGIGASSSVSTTLSPITFSDTPFSARIVIYTDHVRCPDADVLDLFEKQGIPIDIKDQSRMYYSVFISYGHPDEQIASEIDTYLRDGGLDTWFFPRDHVPGEKLHRAMHNNVNSYDRVILVCSKSSLSRKGVLNEIERALEREAREGGADVLIPVAIDDFVFSDWAPEQPDIAGQVRSRIVAKLYHRPPSQAANEELDRLRRALERR